MSASPVSSVGFVDEFAAHLAERVGLDGVTQLDVAQLPRTLPPAGIVLVLDSSDAPEASANLSEVLRAASLRPTFVGRTPLDSIGRRQTLAIVEPARILTPQTTPADFRVLAIVTMYNERDIAEPVIRHLRQEGVEVHVIDNWSTDGGAELIRSRFANDPRVTLEGFPSSGATGTFEWRALLHRVEDVAASSTADWVIHHDCDELREPPWAGVTLRDALYRVERRGFNCVDHTVIDFRPVDDGFVEGCDPKSYFRHFEFGRRPGHFLQIKAWRNTRTPVDLAGSGGHIAVFDRQRVFPYKFLLRHYPVRSQAHGERKILRERQLRWSPDERALGWHIQYDTVDSTTRLLRDPAELHVFDERFGEEFLIERLSGVGLRT